MNTFRLISASLTLIIWIHPALAGSICKSPDAVPSGMLQTLCDDFDSPGGSINSQTWSTILEGSQDSNYVIQEESIQRAGASQSITKGILHLRLELRQGAIFPSDQNSSLSTAGSCSMCAPNCSQSQINACTDAFTQKYGRFEVSGRFFHAGGFAPAVALYSLGQPSQSAPDEIDAFEHPGSNPFTQILTVFSGPDGSRFTKSTRVSDPTNDLTVGFHKLSIDWTPEQLTWQTDDKIVAASNLSPSVPMWLNIVNQTSGEWGNSTPAPRFPQDFSIDYIRVLQYAKYASPQNALSR